MTVEFIDDALQAVLMVSAIAASYLSTSLSARVRARAGLIGVLFQPVWLAAAWMAGQWGEFILSIFYCGAWARMWLNNRAAL